MVTPQRHQSFLVEEQTGADGWPQGLDEDS